MSGLGPVGADRVRKVAAIAISAGGTWLLLRVLYRLANGTQQWLDPELLGVLLLGAVATLWVRAARHVRPATPDRPVRPSGEEPRDPTPT